MFIYVKNHAVIAERQNPCVWCLVILTIEIAVPMLLATVDAVVCMLQLFMWGSWKTQLECGARHVPTSRPSPPHRHVL
jgi:hypothetical protein